MEFILSNHPFCSFIIDSNTRLSWPGIIERASSNIELDMLHSSPKILKFSWSFFIIYIYICIYTLTCKSKRSSVWRSRNSVEYIHSIVHIKDREVVHWMNAKNSDTKINSNETHLSDQCTRLSLLCSWFEDKRKVKTTDLIFQNS